MASRVFLPLLFMCFFNVIYGGDVGGKFEKLNPKSELATKVGNKAAEFLSETRNSIFHLKLVKVKDVEYQLSDHRFRLKLVVATTFCTKEELESYAEALTRCSKTGDDEAVGGRQVCRVEVKVEKKEEEEGEEEEVEGKGEEVWTLVRGDYEYDSPCYYDL